MAHDLVVGAEAPPQARIIPPALPLLDKPLGPLKFLQVTFRNNLATATTETYEQLFHRGRVLGRDYVLANEPSAARHIFGAGAASYRRPVASLRIIRPIAGAGVLTAEGPDWRRQRRTLAPARRNIPELQPDRLLEGGSAWRESIEAELSVARCVLYQKPVSGTRVGFPSLANSDSAC